MADPQQLPINDSITIYQGTDFWWGRCIAHSDGTIKNLAGWTGEFTVYPNMDTDANPVVKLTTANAGMSLDLQGVELASTTLAAAAAKFEATIAVASVSGMAVGDTITVVQNEVSIRHAVITGITGTSITMSAPITDNTAAGAVVQVWDSRYMLTNVLLYMGNHNTSSLDGWGHGLFDLDLTDPYGHEDRWWSGTCVLQEGTK